MTCQEFAAVKQSKHLDELDLDFCLECLAHIIECPSCKQAADKNLEERNRTDSAAEQILQDVKANQLAEQFRARCK